MSAESTAGKKDPAIQPTVVPGIFEGAVTTTKAVSAARVVAPATYRPGVRLFS